MPRKFDAEAASAIGTDGYAGRFERRPEFLFFNLPKYDVIDASTVRERAVEDLKVFYIPDVFAARDEVFLGFGRPNTYLVVPDGTGGYQKFAGKSLKRAPSVVQDTRNFAQSGIVLRLRDLPSPAIERLRAAMQVHHGNKYWTCVNACMRVMEDAGFTSGEKPLSSIYFPYALMKTLLNNGLTFGGKPVRFEVIRTTPYSMEGYTRRIIWAELATFGRHADRKLASLARKSKFFAGLQWVVHAPSRLLQAAIGKRAEKRVEKVVAPALPAEQDYHADIRVRVSMSSVTGTILRQIWGPHALFEAEQDRVNVADYLSETLQAFPQANPSLLTRVKKRVLFARPVIWAIRKLLCSTFVGVGVRSERDIYDMLRTHSEENPNKYNLVLCGSLGTSSRIIIARTTVGAKVVDWVLSKHVLMSGYALDVVFAGEVWKDAAGVIHVSGNSGTYRPTDAEVDAAVRFVQAAFPHLRVVKD